MGVPEDYDNDADRVHTHPLLLSKPEKTGVVPPEDLKVLAKAIGVDNKGMKLPKESTPSSTTAKVGRRSVLDGKRYGPGKGHIGT